MKMRLIVGLVGLLAAAMAVPGCSGGSTVTRKLEFANYTRIDVENAFVVEVIQGSSFAASVTVSKDLVDYLAVAQVGDLLSIKLVPHHPFTDFTLKRLTARAKVTLPALSEVTLSGSSRATISGFKSANKFGLLVSGASSVDLDKIETGTARFDISGASKVTGDLKATQAEFVVSGASRLEITGSADTVRFDASGASNLNLSYFTVQSADATVTGASQAIIDARVKLDLTLSGASRLTFRSNPTMGRLDVSGASTLKHQ